MSHAVTAVAGRDFTIDSQYPKAAEALYAEYCELRLWSIRNDEPLLTRNRRAEIVEQYDAITRFSISERAIRDAMFQAACFAMNEARVLEDQTREAIQGR